ncbi:MAG: peroxiredoxin [archaeon]
MKKEGDKAIDFKLLDKDDKEYSLKDLKNDFKVLYFYPKDDTPVCTIEALAFDKEIPEFNKLNTTIIGISGGDSNSKKKFCDKYKIKILLLSDTDLKVSEKYGVISEKQFMGKKFKGINRTTFIIDKSGKIIKSYENVNPVGHSKDILEFLKKEVKQK